MWASHNQSQPALQITSPVNNAVVNAGQTLSVSVTSPANVTFTNVSVIAGVPIKAATIASSVPVQLSLSIPVDIALGKHTLTAVGVSASGQVLYSGPVDIDVERADLPARLTINWKKLIFSSQGDSAPVRVYGVFADGTIVDVTKSSNLVFSSSNASVATVDSNGRVRGIAQGAASITATYTLTGGSQGPQSVTVSLPVTVPPPVITRSPAALNFNDQNVGTSSSAQGVTVTNVSSNPSLSIGPVTASGDFSETDNCASSSPLAVGGLCTINVSFNPTAAGARTGFVSIGDGMDIVHQLVPLSGTGIGQQGTTATVASSANPSVYGQSVALTATVVPTSGSGAPTGTVTFTDGSNTLGTATLSSAQATFSTSTLTVGTHSITIAYSGDANFLPSASSGLSQVVNQASTTTALTSSANPSILNASITLTASLSVVAPGAGTPTGSITFQDGSNLLATVPLSTNGQTTFSSASLAAGAHSLTASYGGDANFKSSSGSLSQQIAYGICVLYDQTRSVNSGATFPIKLYLCDTNGNDVSSSTIVVHATAITSVSGFAGPVESPGNANPDNDFRYDSAQGPSGGYIFNLSTSGLATGTYSLQFTAGADPTTHAVNFGVQ